MRTLKLCLCFFLILLLTACSGGELKNLASFTDTYNHISGNELDLEDFFFVNGSEDTLRAFIGYNECKFILSVKEDDSGKIESIKLTLTKAEGTLPKNEVCDNFCKVLTHTLMAYCSYDEKSAGAVIDAFNLHIPDTLHKQGELTLKRDNFYFVYYSNEIACDVIIYNTYLHTPEPTEKPVSKPYYGEDFIEKD
jgi:hypothetical protein